MGLAHGTLLKETCSEALSSVDSCGLITANLPSGHSCPLPEEVMELIDASSAHFIPRELTTKEDSLYYTKP